MSARWGRETGVPHPPPPERAEKAWNLPPYDTLAPYETERCVMWVLLEELKFTLNVDFLYQKRLPVRGVNQTGLNRSDFWVLPGKKGARYGVGAWPFWRGRVLNPISTYTHRSVAKDRFERDIIRQQAKIDVVYILDRLLYAAPKRMVELALRGTDRSGR